MTRGNRLVDVGCDHGYLPVSLYLDGKIPGAIAMDVRKGPLSRAQEHISQYGLDAYIETRLSDGLEALKPGEGDTLVIAGMGGPLMERILTDGAEVRETLSGMDPAASVRYPSFSQICQKNRLADHRGGDGSGGWQVLSYDEGNSWRKDAYFRRYSLYFR